MLFSCKLCPIICHPVNCSIPGFLVLYYISLSLLKLMSIESVIPSNHFILCRPLLFLPSIFPSIRVFVCLFVCCCCFFSMSWLFVPVDQITGASVSAPVLPASPSNQGWFHLGLTGLISLLFKGLSRMFSSITVQKHQFFGAKDALEKEMATHSYIFACCRYCYC